MAGATDKLNRVLARQAELAALIETAVAACKAAEQAQAALAKLTPAIAAAAEEMERQRGVQRGWFKELDKSIKSASHALYPSRVEAWIDHFGVGVVAAIAVLAIQYIVETVRNFL